MAKVPAFLTFLRSRFRRKVSPPLKSNLLRTGALITCCVLLGGCAWSLWGTKKVSVTKSQSRAKENLTKPQIAMDSKVGPSVRIPPEDNQDEDQDRDAKDSPSTEDSGKSPEAQDQEAGSEGRTVTVPSEDDSEPIEPSFKKHNHAKYKERIRNKAIDKLKQQKGVTSAMLCRDSMTDLWTLTLYRKGRGYFSFVSYFWDEIDGKWDKGFDSGKMPIKKWKNHLRSSQIEKSCTALKGGHRMGIGSNDQQ